MAVLIAVLAILDAVELTSDPDIFWHLRVGSAALATRSTLPVDLFSYDTAGTSWGYKDLAADVILFLGFARFGYAFFAALKVAVVGSTAAACHFFVRPRDRGPLPLLVGTALVVDSFWLVERPNLFSVGLFAILLALIERARRAVKSESPGELVLALGPILLLNYGWTWLHRFAVVGHLSLVGLALFVTCCCFVPRRPSYQALLGDRPSRRFVAASWIAALVGMGLSFATPGGAWPWRGAWGMSTYPELRERITEWKHLSPVELLRAFPVATSLLVVAAIALALRLVRASRARDMESPLGLWHACVLGGLTLLTASTVRWLPPATIAAAFSVAALVGEAVAGAKKRLPRGVTLLVGAIAVALLRFRQGDAPIALGEDPAWSPRGAVEFAKQHALAGRVANSMELGGYLLWFDWPEVSVLVDGRLLDPPFYLRCLHAEHDAATFRAMRSEDGASWALAVNRPGEVYDGFLARDQDWKLVYWSETAAVYARIDAHPQLAGLAFRFVDPYDVPGSISAALVQRGDGASLPAIAREVERMVEASPDSVRANVALASLLTALGPSRRVDRDAVLDRLLALTHDAPGTAAFVRSVRSADPPAP